MSVEKNKQIKNNRNSEIKITNDQQEHENLANEIADSITNTSKYFEYNITSFMIISAKVMELIEDYKTLNSITKKIVAVLAIKKVLVNTDIIEENNTLIKLIPNTVEIIINLSKDKKKKRKNNIKINIESIEDDIINNLNKLNKENNIENILSIIMFVVNYLDSYFYLSGNDKKKLVINTINKFYSKNNYINGLDDDDKSIFDFIINNLSNIIDSIIVIKKGKYLINITNKINFKKIFPCLR